MSAMFEIRPGVGNWLIPIVIDSPHSGTHYPADFNTVQPPERYRRSEDMYADHLFLPAPTIGVSVLAAKFGRAYCDVNRAFDDLDPASLDDATGLDLAPSAKARLGKGVIWTATPPDGAPLLDGPVPRADYEARIARCWKPYHEALAGLLADTKAWGGVVYHLDVHTMQPVANAMHEDATGSLRPDIVLSDRDGTSCSPAFLKAAHKFLEQEGFSVSINDPFKGAEILRQHGDPANGVHSLQIEVNRALYMNVETFEPTLGLNRTCVRLHQVLGRLAEWTNSHGGAIFRRGS